MSWTIKGEAGKALDATVRTLTSLNVDSAKLSLASLDADHFEWTAATTDAAGSGTIIPDAGQIIEVFHSGTRRFRGHVTIPRVRTGRGQVRAEGAWWWWQRIPLTQLQADDEAATKERPSYVFPTQSLKTTLEALIDRAIANGVPIIRGTVAAMFDFPRITLAEKSCAQALADLLSICPDAVAYYDYSGATGTFPTLHITRRAGMTAETLALGTDAIETLDLAPRLDLEVASIKIGSVTRNATTGANQFAEQTAGTPAAGKNQIIVTSGPEITDFLPRDQFDSFACQSIALPTTGVLYENVTAASSAVNPGTNSTSTGAFYQFITANDQTMIRVKQKAPSLTPRVSLGGRHAYAAFSNGTGGTGILTGRPELFSKVSPAGLYVVTSDAQVPEWARSDNGWTVEQATLDYWVMLYSSGSTEPSWYSTYAIEFGGARHQGYVTPYGSNYGFGAYWKGSLPVQIISASYASLTTIYRQWDYDYLTPPAGLAAELLAAQNWIPYQGRITTVADTQDGAQKLQNKFRVTGGYSPHATMDALPRRIDYDLIQLRRTVELGAPARTDFGTLASRFRRSPKDNIVYL